MRTAKLILAISAAAVAFAASARTVYDAGKALRQNCESGSYANPYTDKPYVHAGKSVRSMSYILVNPDGSVFQPAP